MKKLQKNEVCGTCEQYMSHCSWPKKKKKKGKRARRREMRYPNKH